MEEAIKYIYEDSDDLIVKAHKNELWFNMGNYEVVIRLLSLSCFNINENDMEYLINELAFENLLNIKKDNIESVTILYGEYIPEDEEEIVIDNPFTYITAEVSRLINIDFPSAISSSRTEYYCVDECFMCSDVWEYGSRFILSKDYWDNVELYKHFTKLFEKASMIGITQFYHMSNRPKDNYEIKILPSNTKTRRLGYLKIILEMFKVYPKVSITHIDANFEDYASKYKGYLSDYKNNKGEVIRTKTGNSAKPYIELAEKLGLIHKTVGYYSLGKGGKVYNEIRQHLLQNNQNPFVLDDFDVIYFMELLLKEDFLYLHTIITLAHKIPNISYSYLKSNFKTVLLDQFDMYIENAKLYQTFDKLQSIRILGNRIYKWKKPDVYLEHILMPRLNWLFDMDIIVLNNDLSFDLTKRGRYLCYNISLWSDLNLRNVVSPIEFIDNYYMQMMDMILELYRNKFITSDYPYIKKYIDDSFVLFKTLAPNRVTLSQVLKYVKYMLCFTEKKLIESEDIKKIFDEPDFSEYIYKYQKQYEDGYVQKKQ